MLIGGHLDSWDLGTGAIDDASRRRDHRPRRPSGSWTAGRPRRTIRVVWFGAEEVGGFGGEAYAERARRASATRIAAESDFGADRVWRFETNLPDSAQAGRRPARRRARAARHRAAAPGIGGRRHRCRPDDRARRARAIDLNQSGLRYFDTHHTPDDTLDRIDPEQLRQNVAAWTTMLAIVANAPEEIGAVAPRRNVDAILPQMMTR